MLNLEQIFGNIEVRDLSVMHNPTKEFQKLKKSEIDGSSEYNRRSN